MITSSLLESRRVRTDRNRIRNDLSFRAASTAVIKQYDPAYHENLTLLERDRARVRASYLNGKTHLYIMIEICIDD